MVEGINSTEGTEPSATTSTSGRSRKSRSARGATSAEMPVPGVYTAAHQQERREPLHGLVLRRLRESGLAVVQHRRRADSDRRAGWRRPQSRGHQPADSFRDLNARHRRVTCRETSSGSTHRCASSTPPSDMSTSRSSRTRRRSKNLTTKVTYMLTQNNRLVGYYQPSTKVQKNATRSLPLGGTTAFHTPKSRASGRTTTQALEGGVELDAEQLDLRRSPGRCVRLQVAGHAQWYRRQLRRPRQQLGLRQGAQRAAEHPAQPGPGIGQLLQVRTAAGTHNFKFGGEWFRETSTPQEFAGIVQRRACISFATARHRGVSASSRRPVRERALHATARMRRTPGG